MNDLEKVKSKLVEKSIIALKKAIELVESLNIMAAIDMYNTVLTAFTSLQVTPETLQEEEFIKESLEALEAEHKKIIAIFETGSFENLSSIIEKEVLARYHLLKNHYDEKAFCARNNIDINGIYYKKFKESNLLQDMNQDVIDAVQSWYQEHYGQEIDPITHLAYYNLTGEITPHIIPQIEFNKDIWLMLNDARMFNFYEDKNVYDLLIDAEYAPKVWLKRVNGQYFSGTNETISRTRAFRLLFEMKEDLIIKESGSNDGVSVEKITYRGNSLYLKNQKVDLRQLEERWGTNFIIQRVIRQHPMMAEPHKYSVNTFRMVTLRWNNEIHYLTTFARFGANQEIKDNGGAGEITVGVSQDGEFNDWGMDKDGVIHKKHPTTQYDFKSLPQIPEFQMYIDYVKGLHDRILHQDYISWDIAMDTGGRPIFIEMNFRGAIWLYQFTTQRPIFGEFTEEIVAKAVERRERIEAAEREKLKRQEENKVQKEVME